MSNPPEHLPKYRELPGNSKYPAKTAWGLFGDGEDVGTFNLQTSERVAAAPLNIVGGTGSPPNALGIK